MKKTAFLVLLLGISLSISSQKVNGDGLYMVSRISCSMNTQNKENMTVNLTYSGDKLIGVEQNYVLSGVRHRNLFRKTGNTVKCTEYVNGKIKNGRTEYFFGENGCIWKKETEIRTYNGTVYLTVDRFDYMNTGKYEKLIQITEETYIKNPSDVSYRKNLTRGIEFSYDRGHSDWSHGESIYGKDRIMYFKGTDDEYSDEIDNNININPYWIFNTNPTTIGLEYEHNILLITEWFGHTDEKMMISHGGKRYSLYYSMDDDVISTIEMISTERVRRHVSMSVDYVN